MKKVVGFVIVGALALGVGASAVWSADDARGTDKGTVRSQSSQLVTGNPDQIRSVVAGSPPSAIIRIVPVPTKVGPAYPALASPGGPNIVGNELKLDSSLAVQRAWFEVQILDWDPNGDGTPALKLYQVKIDAMGYMDADAAGDQPDITPPSMMIACAPAGPGSPACVAAFGEPHAKCELGFCKAGYVDKDGDNVVNAWCEPSGCEQGDVDVSNPNFRYFSVYADIRPDGGVVYNAGTLILDIPVGAKGKYTVNLAPDETFLSDTGSPANDIAPSAEIGFVVNILTGQCCFGLGGLAPGCVDGVLRSECGDDEPLPVLFSPGKTCADDCVECATDLQCDDGDACSTETCNTGLGLCVRSCKAGWNIATECCNGGTGVETTIDDLDACTADSCSGGAAGLCNAPDPSNGTAGSVPAAGPCDDGNACTTPDVCDGVSSQADGGCSGIDVNTVGCLADGDCPLDPLGANYPCVSDFCFCTLTPAVVYIIDNDGKNAQCDGGERSGFSCVLDADCPGGVCDQFANGGNCFDSGDNAEKITARVNIGSAGSPINGGQFLMSYDPSCLDFVSVTGLAPYTTTVYGPVVNEAAGSIFIAVGVDPFAGVNGPLGNVSMLRLSFNKIGECNECDLCFANNNPQNSYLVDDEGQRVDIEAACKTVRARGDLVLETPDNIKTNVDCDKRTAVETWAAPSVSHSCGPATITCRGAHESGLALPDLVQNGGIMPPGSSSFCCAASEDRCDQTVGCAGTAANCPRGADGKQIGCWTVTVNDETSLDIDVQLAPPISSGDTDGLTRCIKFSLYGACGITEPEVFSTDVVFGGLFSFNGKVQDKVKIPASGQWGCITAQDQFHTLRSCYVFDAHGGDCVDGQLQAWFEGDPHFPGGNWLIGGNLDGWKKDDPLANPSLDTIDILDFGTFVSQYGICYGSSDTPCGTDGPNADINGDGCVTMSDYNFVLNNFLVSAKTCCCGPQTGTAANPVTEVSVEQLRELGYPELIVADLNGDGVLNADDMDAFEQGARPTKSNDDRKGKGLRSGR